MKGKTGREVLQDIVKNAKPDYEKLTKDEKLNLVAELEQVKATKAKGLHSSARSHINDITKTVAALENEVSFNPCLSPVP